MKTAKVWLAVLVLLMALPGSAWIPLLLNVPNDFAVEGGAVLLIVYVFAEVWALYTVGGYAYRRVVNQLKPQDNANLNS
jgi:hypothetical protein